LTTQKDRLRENGSYKPISERMKDKVAAGDFSEFVIPLDFRILEMLPDEGTEFAGLYQLGETVKTVHKALGVKELAQTAVSSRITSMHKSGLVHKIKALGREGGAWQRSHFGKEALEAWRSQQKST